MVSPNMTYPKDVVKAANKVLQGEPAVGAKPAVAAQPGDGFVCELFAVCKKAEPAKSATMAKPITPGAVEKLATLNTQLPSVTDTAEIANTRNAIDKLEKAIKKPGTT